MQFDCRRVIADTTILLFSQASVACLNLNGTSAIRDAKSLHAYVMIKCKSENTLRD